MRTLLSWLVANIGTVIRIITTIVLIAFFSRSGEGLVTALLLLIPYLFLSVVWSRVGAENGGIGIVVLLITVGLYYFAIFKASAWVEIEPSGFSLVGAPIASLVLGLAVAIFAVANFDEVTSCAFLWNNSAVERFDSAFGYFFNRLEETISQVLFSFAAYEIIRIISTSIANS